MRIIQDNSAKGFSSKTSCLNCKSKLEIDIINCRIDNSDPREEPAYVFICPCCKQENWISFTAWNKKKGAALPF